MKLEKGMDFNDWHDAWLALCEEKGHKLKKDHWGGVDVFAYGGGNHNGPQCTKCGWGDCMHCDPMGEKIPDCIEKRSEGG